MQPIIHAAHNRSHTRNSPRRPVHLHGLTCRPSDPRPAIPKHGIESLFKNARFVPKAGILSRRSATPHSVVAYPDATRSPCCWYPAPAVETVGCEDRRTYKEKPVVAMEEPAMTKCGMVPITVPTTHHRSTRISAPAAHSGTTPAAHMAPMWPCAAKANEGTNDITKAIRNRRMRPS